MSNRFVASNTSPALRVAILDMFQGILDGYHYRLDPLYHIKIVAEALNGQDFEAQLAQNPADLALLGLRAPAAPGSPAIYPLLHALPRLRQQYPGLAVLVFSALADPRQIRAVMDAGAIGFIVKADAAIYPVLAQVLVSVARGGVYYSPTAQIALQQSDPNGAGPALLSPRQHQALALCAAYPRYPISLIARELGVSASTARNLLSQAYERLEVKSRAEAVLRAEKLGLLPNHNL